MPGKATKPAVSQKQRAAFAAAAAGNSTIGIPQSVGKEKMKADPGGKLPKKAKKDRNFTRDGKPRHNA